MQVVLISQKYYNDRCLLTAMIYLFMITKVMFFGIRLTKCHEQGVDLKGDITIQINNIKSAAAAAARGSTIDSVKFATKVS
jgi:hypothetical protein